MHRVCVARLGRGPLNPLERPSDPVVDNRDWNRFDTHGLTIYGADQRTTAITESLAHKAPPRLATHLGRRGPVLGARSQRAPVCLRSAGMPVDGMDPDWRLDREIYRLVVHFRLAPDYQLSAPSGIGVGNLFRVEAVAALLAAVYILIRSSCPAFGFALLVAGAGFIAVILYRYVNVPALGPIPSLGLGLGSLLQ